MKFSFSYFDDIITVNVTSHVHDIRLGHGSEQMVRGQFIDKQQYIEIMSNAIKNGLKSFNNNLIVISLTKYDKSYISLLISYKDKHIDVISVYGSRKKLWYHHFVKIKNRIFLKNIKLKKLKQDALHQLKKEIAFNQSLSYDDYNDFLKYSKNTKFDKKF